MNKLVITLFTLSLSLLGADHQVLENVIIEKENGGMVSDNSAWNSDILKGKTTLLMYVDPDEKSKGEVFKPIIDKFTKTYDESKLQVVVIINLDATWKPNALIQKMLKAKIAEYPRRSFVLDKNAVIVKAWNLPTDEYNAILLNKKAEVLIHHSGTWSDKQISEFKTMARQALK